MSSLPMLCNYIDCSSFDAEKLKTLEQRLRELFGDKAVYLKSSSAFILPHNTSELAVLSDYNVKSIETHLRYASEEKNDKSTRNRV